MVKTQHSFGFSSDEKARESKGTKAGKPPIEIVHEDINDMKRLFSAVLIKCSTCGDSVNIINKRHIGVMGKGVCDDCIISK
jgi:hypothetical protein